MTEARPTWTKPRLTELVPFIDVLTRDRVDALEELLHKLGNVAQVHELRIGALELSPRQEVVGHYFAPLTPGDEKEPR